MTKKRTAGEKRPQFFRGLLEMVVKSLQPNDSASENSLDTEISQIQLALEVIDAELREINAARQVDVRQLNDNIQVLSKQYTRNKEELMAKLNEIDKQLNVLVSLTIPKKTIIVKRLQAIVRNLAFLVTGATFAALYERFIQDEWYPEYEINLKKSFVSS